MASYRKRGKVWYFSFIDQDGRPTERKGCPDKTVTAELARAAESEAAKIKAGVIDPKELAYLAQGARPLAEHVDEFESFLRTAGSRKHAMVKANRARRVIALAGAEKIRDLTLSRISEALAVLRQRDELNQQTINHHVTAVKMLSRWLWKDNRTREHVLAHLATSNPEADRRRVRRALTPTEAARLVETTETGPIVLGMTGPDRAMLYSLAIGTGLRSDELRTLTPERFDFDSDPPAVTVRAGYAKNRREAVQPISHALADHLRPWVALSPLGRPVFKGMTRRTAAMLAIDLKAVGIAPETDSGVVDFHALRGTYITHLVNSGASVKTCQTLARHSTPVLTIGVYAKTSLHDLTGAVEALPDLTPSEPASERQTMQATGTNGRHIRERFADYLPNGDDGNGRDKSDTDGMTGLDHESSMIVSSSENEGLDGVVQDDSGSDGERRRRDSNSGWRFCRPLPYHLATAPR
jgi:integrase